jgi:GAF domain-containing protein
LFDKSVRIPEAGKRHLPHYMTAPVPESEAARLKALREYQILDSAPERAFDEITALAALVCDAPIAHLSLVDAHRQWFKARVGLNFDQTHRDHAFCAHTILGADLLVIGDTLADSRFATNPLVTAEPLIRFYAGAPLIIPDGHHLGALCVLDQRPRELTGQQQSALTALARLAVGQMELRRVSAELAKAVTNVRTLTGLLPICSYCKGIRDDQGYWQKVESYLETNTEASLTHGICPQCMDQHFPEAD